MDNMFIINLYRFLFGYVDILVKGDFPERILNLSSTNGVRVWDISQNSEEIKLSMYAKDFLNIGKIRGKTRLKFKILRKHGLPFVLKKYKFRVGFLIGIIVFLSVLKLLSCFVWDLQVVGNNTVSNEEIVSICKDLGIREGVLISSIDTSKQKQKLLLASNKLSWAAINIEGCVVTVNVSEIKNQSTEEEPVNIVADFDGVIKSIKVLNGERAVEVGDAVRKGDLLVSGAIDLGTISAFVPAKAEIIAELEEEIEFNENFLIEEKIPNGKQKTKRVIETFGIKIPLYFGETKKQYTFTNDISQLSLFSQKMPIKVYSKRMQFFDTHSVEYKRNEIVVMLEKRFSEYLMENKITDYEVLSHEILQNTDNITLKYQIKHSKNIGIKEKILFDTFN